MSKELMQQALEALEEGYQTHTPEFKNAITGLRQTLGVNPGEPENPAADAGQPPKNAAMNNAKEASHERNG